jgi:transcriptional regulator with XRE-family HTH domain
MFKLQGEAMLQTSEVVKAYRAAQRLSLRDFADELNAKLVNTGVTYGTVSRWEQEEKYHEPDMRLLFECLATYRDWRAEWARDCMVSMFPDLFQSGIVRVDLPEAE